MTKPFQPGDTKVYQHTVTGEDAARFPTGEVHNVYSTFALARDAEWAGRLFVLEMKEADEEGIGTAVTVSHQSPALIGEIVTITSTLAEVIGNEIITPYVARVGDRTVASGETRQKILKKEKLERLFQSLLPA